MKRILVAVDGSGHSFQVADYSSKLASKFEAQMTLVFAVPHVNVSGLASVVMLQDYEKEQQQWAQDFLAELVKKVSTPGLKIDYRVLHGNPAEALSDFAKVENYDLVALGARGGGVVERILLGSVSDRVVHICTKPVLIIR